MSRQSATKGKNSLVATIARLTRSRPRDSCRGERKTKRGGLNLKAPNHNTLLEAESEKPPLHSHSQPNSQSHYRCPPPAVSDPIANAGSSVHGGHAADPVPHREAGLSMTQEAARSSNSRSKRRKSTQPPGRQHTPRAAPEEEKLYAIRGIIEEKYKRRKLLYLIDWEDDSDTGEAFEPTWEPAENATPVAVADWEEEKRRRQLQKVLPASPTSPASGAAAAPTAATPTTAPVPAAAPAPAVAAPAAAAPAAAVPAAAAAPPAIDNDASAGRDTESSRPASRRANNKRKAGASEESAPRKKLKPETDLANDGELPWAFVEEVPDNRGNRLSVDIEPRPGFDPSEYLPAPPPQGSQETSQAQATLGVSQTTAIPDSQGLSDSLPSQHTPAGWPLHEDSRKGIAGLEQEVPESHDRPQASIEDLVQQPVQEPAPSEHTVERDSPLKDVTTQVQTSRPSPDETLRDGTLPHCSANRLSPFKSNPNIPSRQPDSRQASSPSFGLVDGQHGTSEQRSSSGLPVFRLQDFQSSARNKSSSQGFLSQPEFNFGPSVSEASPFKGGPPSSAVGLQRDDYLVFEPSQRSINSHHLALIDSVVLPRGSFDGRTDRSTSNTSDSDSSLRPLQPPKASIMDGFPRESTPRLSAVDEFRQMRARIFEEPLADLTTLSSVQSTIQAHEVEPGHPIVSPSAFLPASDDGIAQRPGQPFEGQPELFGSWQDVSSSVAFRGLDMSSGAKPSSAVPQESISAADKFRGSLSIGLTPNISASRLSISPDHPELAEGHEQTPTTVAPSDLTTTDDASIGDAALPNNGLHTLPLLSEGPGNPAAALGGFGYHESREDNHEEPGDGEQSSPILREFIVTLPMAASTRAQYLKTISDNKATMIEFGEVFTRSFTRLPSDSLVRRIDAVFERFLELCDLPAYADTFAPMKKGEMSRHATNSNPKFSFIHEFLNLLKNTKICILIISRPGRTFDYLEAVVSAGGIHHQVLGRETPISPTVSGGPNGLKVILAASGQDLSLINGGVQVVIAFDHAAREVSLPQTLGYDELTPLVLNLVVTYSLEHIDMQLGSGLDGLERKNALNIAIASAQDILKNPEPGYSEPHEIAEIFASFLKNRGDDPDWEPQALPSNLFEHWLSTQGTQGSQAEESQSQDGLSVRKRANDNVEGGPSKRLRVLDAQQPAHNNAPARMSDLLKSTLAKYMPAGNTRIHLTEVPIEQLELMACKIAELENLLHTQANAEAILHVCVKTLEEERDSYKRTVQTTQPKYMQALKDRGTFELEHKKAIDDANTAKKRLEAARVEAATLKKQIKDLQSDKSNAALANSSNPEVAGLSLARKDLEEAQSKAQSLEKKLASAQKETEYSRAAYQDASNSFVELKAENQELRAKVEILAKRADENLVRIHQINADNQVDATRRQTDKLHAIIREREREIERARDELRVIRSGRRETRQVSVPRSPRPGVMSPRPSRAVVGGAGSRGTSPAPFDGAAGPATTVPGMTFNNGRWPHLRD
ncbi:hypothetical protein B0T26DRAFT_672552 [Lasiosphaeria miniovina]|uniref:Chromo domain-containing protein n=1 Tax=Lasiosphaeria miniovina TaxID=1954250 RepID=A0AA40B594_9PEZI|nr:uncharacterized protein B0T26DRAFT_672552 [Lasiosphaeria miniovina]KAK0727946.1 hypothetical protein B0T26DRAFT_672552 [Lasiosphaeria miniovina]